MDNEETELRARLIRDALREGYWATGTNDRFIGGKPDLRISRKDVGHFDIELKILRCKPSTFERKLEVNSGVTKLQKIEMRDMNAAGARAFGLVLVKCANLFLFTNFETLDIRKALIFGCVDYSDRPKNDSCVDFGKLLSYGKEYLETLDQ